MHLKWCCLILAATLAAIILCGCWDRREPENLAFVVAVAFDIDEETGRYRIWAQIANPGAMQAGEDPGGGGGGGDSLFRVASGSGQTFFEAMQNLSPTVTREIFWAHSRVLLISERLARRGLGDLLDLFDRERQLRLINRPLVVDGDIGKLMEIQFPLEPTGGEALDRLVATLGNQHAVIPGHLLFELYSIYEAPGREMIIGRIEVLNEAGGEDGAGAIKPTATVRAGGAALFRNDRMVGWATPEQTAGWLYAVNRISRGTIVVETPGQEGKYVSIEIFRNSARMTPVESAGNPRVKLELELAGRIQEFQGQADLGRESELLRSLENRAAQAVRNRIEEMFRLSQELGSDVFGFGNLFYRKRNARWSRMADDWYHGFYPRLVLEVEVKFQILRSGLVADPF